MSEVRMIDANKLKNDVNAQVSILNALSVSTGIDELRQIGEELQRGMFAEIDKQPTVDAVVRCKDCKHRCGTIYARDRITILKVCELRHGTNEQDFYCKDGEREPANGYGVMAARMLE